MKVLYRFFFIYIAMIVADISANAQDDIIPIYNNGVELVPTFVLNNDFNLDDWYTGLSGGIEDVGYQWGVRLGFQFRPFRKKIQVISDNNFIRQFHERKYLIFLDVDKRLGHLKLFNQHFQFYFGARGGLLMGNYSGTRNDADNHWVVAPLGGLCVNFSDNTFLKIGYNHFSDQLLNVDDGRLNFSVVFGL